MAATTISRATWTDGASPTGTIINNARLQADVYDKIDSLVSSAITFGGLVSSEGFGTHTFSAAGTGGQIVSVRNTTAGTGNYAQVRLGNDADATLATITAFSSTYTTSGYNIAAGGRVLGNGAGGLTLVASHASGAIGLYVGGDTTPTLRISPTNGVLLGTNATETHASNWSLRSNGSNPYGALCIHGDGTGYLFAIARDNAGVVTNLLTIGDNGHVLPVADNSYNIGSSSFRFANVYATTVNTGDILLENGWAFTESYKIGVPREGVGLLDRSGALVAFFGRHGELFCGDVRPLTDLLYQQDTTPASRALVTRPEGVPWA